MRDEKERGEVEVAFEGQKPGERERERQRRENEIEEGQVERGRRVGRGGGEINKWGMREKRKGIKGDEELNKK